MRLGGRRPDHQGWSSLIRRQGYVIWPSYFDSRVSRRRGRRTPSKLSLSSPTCEQIIEACRRLGWEAAKAGGSHPSTWWRKTGYVMVKADGVSKAEVIRRVAGVLRRVGQSEKG